MFDSLKGDIRYYLAHGGASVRLIAALSMCFIVALVLSVFFREFYLSLMGWLIVDTSKSSVWKLWTWFTHLFIPAMGGLMGIISFIFQMFWIKWFADILENLGFHKKILPVFFSTGIVSAMTCVGVAVLAGEQVVLYTCANAVIGLAVVAAVLFPDYTLRFMFIGNVKLKYISMGIVGLYSMSAFKFSGIFSYAILASVVTAVMWSLYMGYQIRDGKSLFEGNLILDKNALNPIVTKKKEGKIIQLKPKVVKTDQQKLDEILDKINQKGMNSLSKSEQEFLNNYKK